MNFLGPVNYNAEKGEFISGDMTHRQMISTRKNT